MKRAISAAVISLLAAAQFALAVPAMAGEDYGPSNDPFTNLQQASGSQYNPREAGGQLPVIIANVIRAALGLLGIIFLVLIIYAGFTWMTAGGDSKKVETAQGTLKRAVIGLIIIMSAYAITSFVLRGVYRSTNPNAL